MTTTRDFLTAPAAAVGSSPSEQLALLQQHSDYLAEIALYLRRMLPDVLCSAVVKGTSQVSNAITDTNSHEVTFQVGGKPVEVYKIFAFNTYSKTMYLSVLSMSSVADGIPIATGGSFEFGIPSNSIYVRLSALDASGTCPVNGPTNPTIGGIFVYGYTIPDFDRIRGSMRS